MKSSSFICILAGIAWLATSISSSASAIANFTGGNGTSEPDQFFGIAGDGWADAWSRRVGSQSTSTFTVTDDNPFGAGEGNYLQINYERTAIGSGNNRTGVARTFLTGDGAIDMTKPYTISFDFRADTLVGWDSSADQIVFSSESTTTISGVGADTPWALTIRGDNGWSVMNGNGSGGIANLNFSDLGLTTLSTNTIYQIGVFIDPINKGYDLTITTGGNTYRASELNGNQLLGFRNDLTATNANVLQFRSYTGELGTMNWSLDNIAVVPEPTATAILIPCIVGMSFLLLVRRHKLRK